MPFIDLRVSGQENSALAKQLATEISRLTKDLLNKKPEVTVVTVSFVPESLWFIDSVPVANSKTVTFHLQIKITDSTNVKRDKANYIKAVHDSMASLLGSIHPISYTAIQEMKADAYGYDGITMENRFIHSQRL